MPTRFYFLAASVLAASLLALPQVQAKATAVIAPASAPINPVTPANLELVFVLDTTGSMGGLLEGAKTKIWGIINDIMQKRGGQNLKVKVGLVAYRDRQDAYLTKVTRLSENLDEVYAELSSFRAEGGGDTPEDVRSAMRDALDNVAWSKPGPRTSQIIFLVGDAPPHDDYADVPDTLSSTKRARAAGMIVNTIQCGNISATTLPWRNIAQYGGGEYFSIAQDGGVQAIATPYDVELASLGQRIGSTYLAYGSSALQKSKAAKQEALEVRISGAKAAPAAERAVNKALNSSAYDESDLIQQVENGGVSLDKLKEEELPDSLRSLDAKQRQAKLDQAIAERKALREQILRLSKQREQYLAEQRSKAGTGKTGFDGAVQAALDKQIK